ncbi:MAG: hypothetical protein EOO39_00260 [Cytophagaceae bacterium]|nr:MAG: hypothetical protein EOO39_00260 [Cytophagaceae bacterium]
MSTDRNQKIAHHKHMMGDRNVPIDVEDEWKARARGAKEEGLMIPIAPWAYQPYGILRRTPDVRFPPLGSDHLTHIDKEELRLIAKYAKI